jgi:hypothetical protein
VNSLGLAFLKKTKSLDCSHKKKKVGSKNIWVFALRSEKNSFEKNARFSGLLKKKNLEI